MTISYWRRSIYIQCPNQIEILITWTEDHVSENLTALSINDMPNFLRQYFLLSTMNILEEGLKSTGVANTARKIIILQITKFP